jgi:hypothetical protein
MFRENWQMVPWKDDYLNKMRHLRKRHALTQAMGIHYAQDSYLRQKINGASVDRLLTCVTFVDQPRQSFPEVALQVWAGYPIILAETSPFCQAKQSMLSIDALPR